jgi:uncharacterized membrane protein
VRRKLLTFAGIGLAVLLVSFAALYAWGSMLDREHHATAAVTIGASPAEVFAAITDVEAFPSWRAELTTVEVVSRDPLRWTETADGDAITYEVVDRRADERLVTHIVEGDLPFGGTWTYTLAPSGAAPGGEGTRVTIEEDGWVDPPPFRVISRFVLGHDASMRAYLAQLARRWG